MHLLVRSYVQNQILFFFSLIGRETKLIICCLLISCRISTRLPARSWSENRIAHCRNVRGRGKSMVVFGLFEKLRYYNERSTKSESLYRE